MTCELCETPGGEILWQNELCRVVLVDDPDYPGFCRVILKRHVAEMTDLGAMGRVHFMAVVLAVEQALRQVMAPDKINLASLGNVVPHLHWHVIPRFCDDKQCALVIAAACSVAPAGARSLDVALVGRPSGETGIRGIV